MASSKNLLLSIDIGSSFVRAGWFDTGGRPAGPVVRRPQALTKLAAGAAEIEAEPLMDTVTATIDEAVRQLGDRTAGAVRGVGLSCFWHSIAAFSSPDRPITPVYTWADTQSQGVLEELSTKIIDPGEAYVRTGAPLHLSYPLAKIAWLRQVNPELTVDPHIIWLSVDAFLFSRLFGVARTSRSMASGYGLWNQLQASWDEELLEVLGVRAAQMPVISDDPVHGLVGKYARRWPDLAQVPWFPAIGDGAADNLGNHSLHPGEPTLSLATSGAVRVVTTERLTAVPKGLFQYHAGGSRWLVGGALSNAGNLWKALNSLLRFDEKAVWKHGPDDHGLTALPFFQGERAPGWRGGSHATIQGINEATPADAVVRAFLEAVAYRYASVLDLVEERFGPVHRLLASGGGAAHYPGWLKIIADVLDREIIWSGQVEASLRGAALYALENLQLLDLSKLHREKAEITFAPDPAAHRRYTAARRRHQRLYNLVSDFMEEQHEDH